MERLLPAPATEPPILVRAGSGALHTAVYTLLALMVFGAAWVRFNDQIAETVPALAGPAEDVADTLANAHRIKGLLEVPILPASATQEAVASMALPAADAHLLTEAVQRRRVVLIQMPLIDLGTAATDQGRMVRVSAAGYTRLVKLSRTPVTLTLPVGPVGTVSFQTSSADGVDIGTVTLAGPTRLPDLPAGDTLEVGVIAQ
jgi:hypothetical protein